MQWKGYLLANNIQELTKNLQNISNIVREYKALVTKDIKDKRKPIKRQY